MLLMIDNQHNRPLAFAQVRFGAKIAEFFGAIGQLGSR
jgi:hypothetical protein